MELIVKFNGDMNKVCKELNAFAEIIDCNYAVLTISEEKVISLYNYNEIEYYEYAKNVSPSYFLERELRNTNISPVKIGRYKLCGKGTAVGIIDSGIDYTHKDFIASDGSSRIMYIWDQSTDGKAPEGFLYGTEYDCSDINNAIKTGISLSCMDLIGHGTAVSGIAAGNEGAASESSIIAVKLGHSGSAKTTDIIRALKYMVDKAAIHNLPLAVNISYGMNDGSHSGNSLFEQCINSLCEKWKTAVIAAVGNEGGSGHHFGTYVLARETSEVEFICSGLGNSMYLDIWKSFNDDISIELISPYGTSSGIITEKTRNQRINMGGIIISADYRMPTHYSMKQEIKINFDIINEQAGIWKLILRCSDIIDGRVDIWMPTVSEVSENTSFLRPEESGTMTLPSTAENVISVGGYDTSTESLAFFSGKGFKGINPDLTAPAVRVYSSKAGGGHDSFSGTSMAAPFVCGAAALIMEWAIVSGRMPFLYGQILRAYLLKGAKRNKNINYPNKGWGYGILDLSQTISLMENDL